ncbi:MAG TPA: GntP family permease [Symbiobacteriaceae bacterium]|nr:GntP family permease [Symbiobacteriaceae bacterium]
MLTGPILLVILAVAIAFIVWSTAKLKLHPFLALVLTAYGVGLAAKMPILDVAKYVNEGFGNLMTSIGLVIVAGTIIGVMLEKSGAAVVMADTILKLVGEKRPALAMSIIGYIVSIPVFCDSGFVILSSLNKALSKRSGVSLTALGIALSTGLYATHVMVPPTPGPLAAAGNLKATNLGLVIMIGLVCAIPATIVGYLWAKRFSNHFDPNQKFEGKDAGETWEELKAKYGKLPSPVAAFAPLIMPILLIALSSVANFPSAPFGKGHLKFALNFLGTPVTALIIGIFLCFFLVKKIDENILSNWIGAALKDAAVILVVTGAGGSLGRMLAVTKIGDYLGATLAQYSLGIFLPFVIAAAIKTAQGSSTVALVTTSAIIAPMLGSLGFDSEMGRVLMVMAVAAGSMVVSHANDSYFWVVSQFSNMEVPTAYRAQTVGTLIQGIVGILTVALLSFILV